MRDMVMQMTGSNGLLSVPDEHLPGLVALVLLGPAIWLGLAALRGLADRGVRGAAAAQRRVDALGFRAKVALLGLTVGAVVHAVIVPTHWGEARVTAVLFALDVVACAAVGAWTFFQGRGWRVASAAVLGGTACAYAFYIVRGWETMDLVGLVTSTVEAAAALVVLAPVASPTVARQYAVSIGAVTVALTSLLGTAVIASAAITSDSPPAPASAAARNAPATPSGAGGMADMAAPKQVTALSLSTKSAAGNIDWPDSMSTMAAGMKMAEPNCTATPTASQRRAAVTLVNRTVAAAQKYASLSAATAAGYVPVTPTGKRIVHYVNPVLYRAGATLDPAAIPALVYVNTSHGAVLAAAMYFSPQRNTPPQPGGCLTQWHIHTDLCFDGGRVVGTEAGTACAPGSANRVTQPMMHVWMVPVSGGPLAPDPPARSEVQAATHVPAPTPTNGTA